LHLARSRYGRGGGSSRGSFAGKRSYNDSFGGAPARGGYGGGFAARGGGASDAKRGRFVCYFLLNYCYRFFAVLTELPMATHKIIIVAGRILKHAFTIL
jgi:hypothetical protein